MATRRSTPAASSGIRAGSATYPGAALLCVAGASCGLVGMVRYVGHAADAVRLAHPEVVGEGRVQAWVVGPGSGDDAASALAAALADDVPVVVDADALAHVDGPLDVPAVLTPHAGELAADARRGARRGRGAAPRARPARGAAASMPSWC